MHAATTFTSPADLINNLVRELPADEISFPTLDTDRNVLGDIDDDVDGPLGRDEADDGTDDEEGSDDGVFTDESDESDEE